MSEWLVFASITARVPQAAGMRRGRKCWWRGLAAEGDADKLISQLKWAGITAWKKRADEMPVRPLPQLAKALERDFADYQREMAQPAPPQAPLPTPRSGPIFGRSPGLSKSGPQARYSEGKRA